MDQRRGTQVDLFTETANAMSNGLTVTTNAFSSGGPIPGKYTCEGADVSPPFNIQNPPEGTASLLLLVDDPDAPQKTFTHWILFNLPPDTTALPEGLDVEEHFGDRDGAPLEGVNDFGSLSYGGPCPPPGTVHHYHFRFYALDTRLDLEPGATKKQVTQRMNGHVLDETDYIGTYERS